jgi:hypothetical protein
MSGIPACAGMTVIDEALQSTFGVFRTTYVIPAQAGILYIEAFFHQLIYAIFKSSNQHIFKSIC